MLWFFCVPVGQHSQPRTVSFTNGGNTPVTVTSIEVAGDNPADFQFTLGMPLPVDLAAGAELTGSVQFAAVVAGGRSAMLSVSLGGGLGSLDVPLGAVAASGPPLAPALGQASVDFGNVIVGLGSGVVSVGVQATCGAVTITSITASDPAFVVDSSKTRLLVASGSTATFDLSFNPTHAGALAGTITVAVDGGAPLVIPVKGNANPDDLTARLAAGALSGCSCTVGARSRRPAPGCAWLLAALVLARARRRARN